MMAAVMRTWLRVVATTLAMTLAATVMAPATGAAGATVPVPVGSGAALPSLRQVVRTDSGLVYVFAADAGALHVYRATSPGIPTVFEASAGLAEPALGVDVRLGAAGVVHVVYVRGDTGEVVYRTFSTATDTWGIPEVVTTAGAAPGVVASLAALAVDSTGTPEVVAADSGGVRAFRRVAGAWAPDGAPLSTAAAANPTITVDRQDRVWVAWLESDAVRVASRGAAGWAAPAVVATGARLGGATDQGPSIAVDANDQPLVAFTTASGALGVRIASGTAFSDESPSPAVAGLGASLALSNDDRYALTAGSGVDARSDAATSWTAQPFGTPVTGPAGASLRFDVVRDPDCTVIDGVVGDTGGALEYLAIPLQGATSGDRSCTSLSAGHQTTPSVEFTARPGDPTSTPDATIAWRTNGAVAEQQCSLDAAQFAACTSPQTVPNTHIGPHSFRVRVANAAGEQIATARWTATLPLPVISVTSSPPDPTESRSATVAWTLTGTGAVTCKLDAQPSKACSSPQTYTALAQGRHTVLIRAANSSGAAVSGPIAWTIAVATAPPTVAIGAAPAALVGPGPVSVAWTTTGAVGTTECRVDLGAWVACATPRTVAALARGPHSFDVRVANSLGSATDSASWVVGDPPPAVAVTSRPDAISSATAATIAWNGVGAVAATGCAVDGAPAVACTSPLVLSGLAFGDHAVTIVLSNGTGSGSAQVTWTVVPPQVTFTDRPGAVTASSTAVFGWTVSGTVDATTCRLDDGPFGPCISPWAASGLLAGAHVVTVRATNGSGFGQQSVSFQASPPDVASAAVEILLATRPPAATSSTAATIAWTTTGAVTDTTCSLDGATPAPCSSPLGLTGLPIGDHSVAIAATGAGGNATRIVAWRVTGPEPVVTLVAFPDDPTPARSARFGFLVSGDVTSTQCSLDDVVPAPCVSPLDVSGLGAGLHHVVIRATGPAGAGEAGFTWLVADPMAITILSRPPATSALPTATIVWATSAPAASTTCSVDGAAADPCSSPFTAANLDAGAHEVSIVAAGGAGSDAVSVQFTTNPDAPIVAFTRTPAKVNGGKSAVFAWRITGHASTVQCRIDGAAWASCAGTRQIGGLRAGTHVFTVRASNAFGGMQASFSWSVAGVPHVTLLVRPAVSTNHTEATFRYSITGGARKVACRLDSGRWRRCGRAIQYLHVAPGWHVFRVRAQGPGGTGSLRFAWKVS
jgi:hypothetical protein